MKARYGEALSESIGWHRQQMMEMGERAWPNGLFEMRPCVVERVGPEEAIAYALVGREGWCGHLKGRVRAQWHFARLRGGAFRVDAQKADAAQVEDARPFGPFRVLIEEATDGLNGFVGNRHRRLLTA